MGVTCTNGKNIVLEFQGKDDLSPNSPRHTSNLTITPDVYCWKKDKSILIEAEEPFAEPTLNEDIFVFGSFFLHTFLLEFHLDKQCLGIQEVAT